MKIIMKNCQAAIGSKETGTINPSKRIRYNNNGVSRTRIDLN